MVHLNIFGPARKLLFVSKLILKASKRILSHAGASSLPIPDTSQMTPGTVNVSHLIEEPVFNVPKEGLIYDREYYKPDSEGGFCIFRVENTLFKVFLYFSYYLNSLAQFLIEVHRCYLLREPSAFGDMFSLPAVQGSCEGRSDEAPVPLFDTVEQFRDLLWALYAMYVLLNVCVIHCLSHIES